MGHRTIKRVPLDFEWPMHRVWKGYIDPSPTPRECAACNGHGSNTYTRMIEEDFYNFEDRENAWHDKITQDEVEALVAHGRLRDFTHTWDSEKRQWIQKTWETPGFWCPNCREKMPQLSPEHLSGYCTECEMPMQLLHPADIRLVAPCAEEVNIRQRQGGIGSHDAINRWILVETRARRLGLYGKCPACHGRGRGKLPRKLKKRAKQWREYEPPSGPGWQLWETTSEGSPVTPVFTTAEELAVWCEENATIFGPEKLSRSNWLSLFLERDIEYESMGLAIPGKYVGSVAGAPLLEEE